MRRKREKENSSGFKVYFNCWMDLRNFLKCYWFCFIYLFFFPECYKWYWNLLCYLIFILIIENFLLPRIIFFIWVKKKRVGILKNFNPFNTNNLIFVSGYLFCFCFNISWFDIWKEKKSRQKKGLETSYWEILLCFKF